MRLLILVFAAVVCVLVLLAAYTAVNVRRVERDYPPLGEFISVDGLRLHYVDEGDGPPIVLLHGASANLRDFTASLLPLLAADHRVIALDRPGYGYSDGRMDGWLDPAAQARLLRAALNALGVRRPVLVGHSWSGSVVLAYALEYPGELAGAVLLAGAAYPWTGGVDWQNHAAGWPLIGPLFAATVVYPAGQVFLDAAVAGVFEPNPVPRGYVERTAAPLALRPRAFRTSAREVRLLSDYLTRQAPRYPGLRTPLLLITGESDTVVPPWNHADRLIEAVPGAIVQRLPDTGHAPHHAHPQTVSALIRAFSVRLARGSP